MSFVYAVLEVLKYIGIALGIILVLFWMLGDSGRPRFPRPAAGTVSASPAPRFDEGLAALLHGTSMENAMDILVAEGFDISETLEGAGVRRTHYLSREITTAFGTEKMQQVVIEGYEGWDVTYVQVIGAGIDIRVGTPFASV